MKNEELAELAAIVSCVLHGFVHRRSASSVRVKARWGLKDYPQVKAAISEWLGERSGTIDMGGVAAPGEAFMARSSESSLLMRVRDHLGNKARRQNVIEQEMGLEAGALDGVLTEANGFVVNAQGWVKVAEAVGAT